MTTINWLRYPRIAASYYARTWLEIQCNLDLAPNTIKAYGYALEDFHIFAFHHPFPPETATREHIALYIKDLSNRPLKRAPVLPQSGLSRATIQQRLTAVRLYYDYLVEEGLRSKNPVGRGRYVVGKNRVRSLGLFRHQEDLPWLPSDKQWQAILEIVTQESLRNRLMFALSCDAALRREELCALRIDDINASHRLITLRAQITKNRLTRVVPYTRNTGFLLSQYLKYRRSLSMERGLLFLSESRRNWAQPITIWSWSKIVRKIALKAHVLQFTPHTIRHIRLTDLARAGWDILEIAKFAGHRWLETTQRYIHLSGRELASKFERTVASLDYK